MAKKLPLTKRDANETRAKILKAARKHFSQHAYEQVGVRAIAGDAGVDPALVNRYFGTKENLFREVVEGAFVLGEEEVDLSRFGMDVVEYVFNEMKLQKDDGYGDFRILLHSASSPVASSIVGERFHEDFTLSLAKLMKGKDAALRAALIASYILGLATMKVVLDSPAMKKSDVARAKEYVAVAIQKCVEG